MNNIVEEYGNLSIEQLKELMDAKRETSAKPKLKSLQKLEEQVDTLRRELKALGVKIPPRFIEVADKDCDIAIMALYKDKNNSLNLKKLSDATGFSSTKIAAIRNVLKNNGKITEKPKGLSTMLTLTEDGIDDAKNMIYDAKSEEEDAN